MKKIILIINIIFLANTQVFAEILEVDNHMIFKLMSEGIPLIDIRTETEWNQTGIIKKSNLLTFFDKEGNFNVQKWISNLDKIAGKKDPLIIMCRSGRRSRIVSNYLNTKVGYTTIYHATNGILSWLEAKRETVAPKN